MVTYSFQDCDRYIGNIVIPWIVKPGFCSVHFTVTLAGLKNVNRYIGNIVLSEIVISEFHCSCFFVECNVPLADLFWTPEVSHSQFSYALIDFFDPKYHIVSEG